MNRRTFLTSAVAVTLVAGAGVATAATDLLSSSTDAATGPSSTVPAVETATVQRGDLSTDREFKAAVSFGDAWAITTAAVGTITDQHPVGTIVGFGDTLLRIDDRPLFLGRGAMPMYRELYHVDTRGRDQNGKRLERLSGPDVTQLQSFLLDAGVDTDGVLEADGIYGATTEKAVEAWQESVGLAVTGRVDNGQLLFGPDPVRVASESRIGAPFTGLEVNNAEPVVLVDTSNRDRGALPVGAEVDVTLADGTGLAGTVTGQEQVTNADGSLVWRTTIKAAAELPGDASTATVTVTELLARDVLLVPVGALLALAEGGFAVEIPTDDASRLVRVDVGEVLDGQAEINGEVAAGDEVVIPT